MGLLSTFSLASQSLRALQMAIQTTGHNVANAATPGFARQRVEVQTAFPSFEGGVYLGQGVNVTGVRSVLDHFVEAELLTLNGSVGYAEAEQRALAGVSDAFPTSGGVDASLSAFFGALSDLSNNPSGLAERVSLTGKAKALGESFARTREVLTSLQGNLDQDLESFAKRVNVLASQIATLNHQINSTETANQPANDFRDQRQTLLQEIVNLTGASVREESDGQATVIADGLLLVSADRSASLDTSQVDPLTGFRMITYNTPEGLSFDASSIFQGGQIGATLNMRNVEVQGYIDRLDQLAKTLVDEVNQQHALGFDLTGAAGGSFFTPIVSVTGAASAIQVDNAVAADPRLIAAAGSAGGVPGDNANALALVNLQSTAFAALGGMTLNDNFLALAGDVGARGQDTEGKFNFQKDLLTQTQARRESVSGVNTDEEMTNLLLFQRSFEASSRMIVATNEMYQSLIDMVR